MQRTSFVPSELAAVLPSRLSTTLDAVSPSALSVFALSVFALSALSVRIFMVIWLPLTSKDCTRSSVNSSTRSEYLSS